VRLAARAIKALDNQPEPIVIDGGFSSRDNLVEIEALGIRDVAFRKAPGLSIQEMVKRTWLDRHATGRSSPAPRCAALP
jgi:hypothetical protein